MIFTSYNAKFPAFPATRFACLFAFLSGATSKRRGKPFMFTSVRKTTTLCYVYAKLSSETSAKQQGPREE